MYLRKIESVITEPEHMEKYDNLINLKGKENNFYMTELNSTYHLENFVVNNFIF